MKKYLQVADLMEGKRIAASNRFSENVHLIINQYFYI